MKNLKKRINEMEDFLSIREYGQDRIDKCLIHLYFYKNSLFGEKRLDMEIGTIFEVVQLELEQSYSILNSLLGE